MFEDDVMWINDQIIALKLAVVVGLFDNFCHIWIFINCIVFVQEAKCIISYIYAMWLLL